MWIVLSDVDYAEEHDKWKKWRRWTERYWLSAPDTNAADEMVICRHGRCVPNIVFMNGADMLEDPELKDLVELEVRESC